MASRRKKNLYNLREAKMMYFRYRDGVTDELLAAVLNVTRTTAYRYRKLIGAYEVVEGEGKYSLIPDDNDVLYARTILQRYNDEFGTSKR